MQDADNGRWLLFISRALPYITLMTSAPNPRAAVFDDLYEYFRCKRR
jgi:hypothetical protein